MQRQLSEVFGKLNALAPLLVRLSLGALFFESGRGKLAHLERTVGFFRDLGIPFPELQAPFIATLEVIGGIALAVGFLTPLFSLLLASTMFVALLTAKLPEVGSPLELLAESEAVYLAVLIWLAVRGGEKLSLDFLLAKKWFRGSFFSSLTFPSRAHT